MALLAGFLGVDPYGSEGWRPGPVVVHQDASVGEAPEAYRQATVWRAINVLAAAVATLPLGTFRRLERGREPVPDHWSDWLVSRRPNTVQTSFRWRLHLMGQAVLRGNYYARKLWAGGDRTKPPAMLWPMDPDRTELLEVKSDGSLVYRYTKRTGAPELLTNDDVLHFRGFGDDPLVGLSVFDLMRSTLSQAASAQAQRTAFLKNEMRPSVVITHPGDLGEGGEAAVAASFAKAYGGPSRAGRVLVLDEGMEIKPFYVSAKDAQFIESEAFRTEEFLRYVGVPGVLCGYADKTATYASAESFFQSFKDHNVFPWTTNLAAELEAALLSAERDRGLTIRFNLDAMLRPDSTARAAFYRALVELGILTRNEVRELEGRNPLPGLDEPLTPLNMSRAGRRSSDVAPQDGGGQQQQAVATRRRRRSAGPSAADAIRRRRLEAIAREAVVALVRREVVAFAGDAGRGTKGGAARYAGDPAGWRRYVETFYAGHSDALRARLGLSAEAAEGYCLAQREELLGGGVAVVEGWEARQVARLLELALEV